MLFKMLLYVLYQKHEAHDREAHGLGYTGEPQDLTSSPRHGSKNINDDFWGLEFRPNQGLPTFLPGREGGWTQ